MKRAILVRMYWIRTKIRRVGGDSSEREATVRTVFAENHVTNDNFEEAMVTSCIDNGIRPKALKHGRTRITKQNEHGLFFLLKSGFTLASRDSHFV
ncbi:MAG TPA: hypothetical protein VIP51_15085 [Eoetvoesiella sp.]